MSAILVVGGVIAASGLIAKAVPAFIPDEDRRKELEAKDKEREEGLSKSEEKELAALLSAGQAGMNKVALDSIQDSMAGAGMLSPGSALLTEKMLMESTQQAAAQTGRQVAAADEAAKQAAELRYQQFRAEEDAWEDNRRKAGWGLAGDVALAAGTGMMAGGTTSTGKPLPTEASFEWGRAAQAGLGTLAQSQAGGTPQVKGLYGNQGGPDISSLTPTQQTKYYELINLMPHPQAMQQAGLS